MTLYFREATSALLKTYPFVLLRMGLALAFSAGIVVLILAGIWIASVAGTGAGIAAVVLGLFLVALLFFFLRATVPAVPDRSDARRGAHSGHRRR
ncbi:hypothetical protein OB905_09425 [Halobacteria archaeon AArc-dxtr1]|nr:hypothetical protein [Halobacteria archaeon AArc-dxtr1]